MYTRHEHPMLLPTTQAAHPYTNSPYSNMRDFLDPTLLSDALMGAESSLDLQSNGALQDSTVQNPLGLGIFFNDYDPFAEPMSSIVPYKAGSDDGHISPTFSRELPSYSLLAPDFPPSDHSSSDDGSRTPSDVAPASPRSPSFWLADPWTISESKTDATQAAALLDFNSQQIDCGFTSAGSPLVGLFPDFNMYLNTAEDINTSMGIDPKCLLLRQTPLAGCQSVAGCQSAALTSSPMHTSVIPPPQTLTTSPTSGSPSGSMQDSFALTTAQDVVVEVKEESDTLVKHPFSASPGNVLQMMDADGCHDTLEPLQSNLAYFPPYSGLGMPLADHTLGAASPETPVFNAHLGVNELDLVRRADRYRRRYPGQEIDRRWFLVYAGRLTSLGQPMEDYRCYIEGCSKTNKRRDHILVHVGSHVSERPFACAHCGMRFLRRNECKRHEANHTGVKPFTCEHCLGAIRFARQDLLTRHMRRAHGIDRTSGNRGKRPREQSPHSLGPDVEGDQPSRKHFKAELYLPQLG